MCDTDVWEYLHSVRQTHAFKALQKYYEENTDLVYDSARVQFQALNDLQRQCSLLDDPEVRKAYTKAYADLAYFPRTDQLDVISDAIALSLQRRRRGSGFLGGYLPPRDYGAKPLSSRFYYRSNQKLPMQAINATHWVLPSEQVVEAPPSILPAVYQPSLSLEVPPTDFSNITTSPVVMLGSGSGFVDMSDDDLLCFGSASSVINRPLLSSDEVDSIFSSPKRMRV